MIRLLRSFALLMLLAARCPRMPRSRCSPPPPTGLRSRASSAATRSMSTAPRPHSRTCIASMRSRASSPARARRISSCSPARTSRSAGCRCCCRSRATRASRSASPATSKRPRTCGCSRCPRPSTARWATCTRWAIRTSISIRTTSRRWRRRSRRAWPSSTRRTHRTSRVAERTSSHAGSRRSRAGRKRLPRSRARPWSCIHRDQSYLCNWLGLKVVASIEPKPGVPPSAGYLGQLVAQLASAPPKMILRNAYNDPKAAEWLSERVHAPGRAAAVLGRRHTGSGGSLRPLR